MKIPLIMIREFLKKSGVWGLRFIWSTVNTVRNGASTPQFIRDIAGEKRRRGHQNVTNYLAVAIWISSYEQRARI